MTLADPSIIGALEPGAGAWQRGIQIGARIFTISLSILLGLATIGVFGHELVQDRFDHVPEVDCQGYLMMAQSFSRFQWPRWQDDFGRFHGHVWVSVGDNQVMAKYPPGWPLLAAVGYRIGGLSGALWVNRILAILGAIAFFLLACEFFNSTVAFICTFIWLFSPMVIDESNYPYTHGPDLVFVLMAFIFVVYWMRYGWTWAAVAGGFCCGFLPLIRPTSALIWPAIALSAFLIHRQTLEHQLRSGERTPTILQRVRQLRWNALFSAGARRTMLFVLAMAVPLAFFACYNRISFGSVFRTGYALTGEQSAFDFSHLAAHLNAIFPSHQELLQNSCWMLIAAALLFRGPRRNGLMFLFFLWFFPIFVLYLGYYWQRTGMQFLRFYLCIAPAAVLCIGMLLTRRILQNSLARLLMMTAFCTWVYFYPPAVFKHRTENDGLVSWLAPASDKSINQSTIPEYDRHYTNEPYVALTHFLQGRKATVYSSGAAYWTASLIPGIVSYDLSTFNEFARRRQRDSNLANVMYDPVRVKRIEAIYNSLGREGLRRNLLDRLAADSAAGREVYFITSDRYGPLYWIESAGWNVVPVAIKCPDEVYRVTRH